ncbi:MAG TPA: hypothetical protein VGF25_08630 [Thermoleophilaceae bacterium]
MLAACGGGGDKEDVQVLLDKAFTTEMRSADLKLDATIQLKGSDSLDRPVRIQAEGPFRGNDGKLPSADLELRIGTDGGGQTIETGFLSTGDRAFVRFQDVYYEQPASQVRKANEQLRKKKGSGTSLTALGLDPRSWLDEAKDEGDADVAGVKTRHVSGTLDVVQVMENLNQFVRKSGSAIGGATGQAAPKPLGQAEIQKISEVVKDPTFDVYVGKDDDVVRRVSGRVEIDVPKEDRASVGGITGGTLEFSVEFDNVNGDQQIEAPAKARPLSELTRTLGGGGVLPGTGQGGETSDGSRPGPNGGDGVPPATSDDTPDADAFKAYADCLDKARPEDTAALQKCADLLK